MPSFIKQMAANRQDSRTVFGHFRIGEWQRKAPSCASRIKRLTRHRICTLLALRMHNPRNELHYSCIGTALPLHGKLAGARVELSAWKAQEISSPETI
jgi:hypothetical protein